MFSSICALLFKKKNTSFELECLYDLPQLFLHVWLRRVWEDFAALLNLLQVTHPHLPEKIGEFSSV